MYAMFDFHGHSSRRNVFIYGPKVTHSNQKSLRAKSLAYLLATMTDMFKFNSCLWKVYLLYQISRFKKRTLRGVFLSLAKTKYAFTFEHSVSNFDTKNNRGQPWTDRTLRDMGGFICSAFGKFVLSSLKSPQIFFSDYYIQPLDKSLATDDRKKAAFKEFSVKLAAVLEGKEPVLDFDCLVGSMQEYEGAVEPEDYSEGGSDSEFSDEDLKGAEKRVLLNNIERYTESYAKGLPVSNFIKTVKQGISKVNNKKKKNDVEEFVKLKEFRQRFEGLEKKNIPAKVQASLAPQINYNLVKSGPEKTITDIDERILPIPMLRTKPLTSNRAVIRLENFQMKRDRTMPQLKRSDLLNPSQSLVIEPKKLINKNQSTSGVFVSMEEPKKSFNLKSISGSHTIQPGFSNRKVSQDRPTLAQKFDSVVSNNQSVFVSNSQPRRRIERKLATLNERNSNYDPRASIFKDLLERDIQEMKSNFLQEIDLQKKIIAKATKERKPRDPIAVSIQTLELNLCTAARPVLYKPRVYNFPVAKFYTRPPNYY